MKYIYLLIRNNDLARVYHPPDAKRWNVKKLKVLGIYYIHEYLISEIRLDDRITNSDSLYRSYTKAE